MNIDSFALIYRVMTSGGIRAAAQDLGCPPSTVAAAVDRLQSQIATALVATSDTRLLPTLEGRRLMGVVRDLAELVEAIHALSRVSWVDPRNPAHLCETMEQDGVREVTPSCLGEPDGGSGSGAATDRPAERPVVTLAALLRFVAVCRRGSIRGAAIAGGLGQPQLTRQMKGLEAAMGGTLFVRLRNGVVPTALGQALLRLAERVEVLWSELEEGSSERFRRGNARARLGAVAAFGFESRISRMLGLLVAQWPRRRPGMQLFVSSGTAEGLIAGVRAGLYDLALLDTQAVPDEMQGEIVSRSPLAVLSSFAIAARHPGGIADLLVNAPLAAPSPRSGLRQRIGALIENEVPKGLRSRVRVTEVDMIPVIGSLVSEHDYVSVLPLSALAGIEPRLSAIVLDPSYDMGLSLVRSRSGAAESLMRTALAILAEGRFTDEAA